MDGLNRVVQAGSSAIGYDARGNIASDGAQSYSYSSENRLTHVVNPTYNATINYDPLGRYIGFSPTAQTSRQDVSDGDRLIYLKKDNAFLSRTVFGPGIDEPIYQVDNLGRRTWFAADERGSIVAAIPADGNVSWTGRYDEYGNYASRAFGFGFAGAYWHTPTGLYYMRNRWYHPKLGRFLQTDPIGYGDGMNMYAYVKGDPVNFTDPMGLEVNDIFVTGHCVLLCRQGPVWELEDRIRGADRANGDRADGSSDGGNGDKGQDAQLPLCGSPRADPTNCTVVVTGTRPASLPLLLAGSQRGGNNMGSREFFGVSDEELKDRLNKAKGQQKLKLQRELKDRQVRNLNKSRGGGIFRRLFNLFIGDWQLQMMYCSNPANANDERCLVV